MKIVNKLIAGAALALSVSVAQAIPMTGNASVGGGGSLVTVDSYSTPTTLDFGPGSATPGFGDVTVGILNGDLATVVGATGLYTNAITDITSNPSGAINNFIVLGNLEFDLTNFTMTGTGATISGVGVGTFIDNGGSFDPTPGYFIFTTQSAGTNSNTWSASLTTTAPPGLVPVPAPLALVGLGLLILGMRSRKAA